MLHVAYCRNASAKLIKIFHPSHSAPIFFATVVPKILNDLKILKDLTTIQNRTKQHHHLEHLRIFITFALTIIFNRGHLPHLETPHLSTHNVSGC